MDRQKAIIVGTASGSFLLAAAVGVAVALNSSGGVGNPHTTAAGATAGALTGGGEGSSVAQLPAAPAQAASSCTIGLSGNAAQVTLTTADAASACTSLAQTLARSSGGFWQTESFDGRLGLVCVMRRNGTSAMVLDSGGEILGHELCGYFQGNGWTEDVGAEASVSAAQRAAAQVSSSAAVAAQKRANDEQAASTALAALQQDAITLAGDVGTLKSDVSATGKDLAAERSDAAQGGGDQCLNASTTVYNDAATTIYNDEVTTLGNDVQSAGRDVASARSDIAALQRADAALSVDGLSIPAGADTAVTTARQGVSQLIASANADVDAVATDVSQAYQVADGMATGPCSDVTVPGSPPAPPSHLS